MENTRENFDKKHSEDKKKYNNVKFVDQYK